MSQINYVLLIKGTVGEWSKPTASEAAIGPNKFNQGSESLPFRKVEKL